LLDEQLCNNPKYVEFIQPRFIPIRVVSETKQGELFELFNVKYTPTVIVCNNKGKETDRILGYTLPPDWFFTRLEDLYNNKNTLNKLVETYKNKPNDVKAVFLLADKYRQLRIKDKESQELYKKVIEKSEVAKEIILPFMDTGKQVNIYEQSLHIVGFDENEFQIRLLEEYPQTVFREDALTDIISFAAYEEGRFKDLEPYFKTALIEFPGNEYILWGYVDYVKKNKEYLREALAIMDEVYINGKGINSEFLNSYALLLNENGQEDMLKNVYSSEYIEDLVYDFKFNIVQYARFWSKKNENNEEVIKIAEQLAKPSELIEPSLGWAAEIYLNIGDEEKALEHFGPEYIKLNYDDPKKLNSFAYWWSRKGKNLEGATQAVKRALGLDEHHYYWQTFATINRKMNNYDEAIKCLEKSLELNPNYGVAKKELRELKAEMEKNKE